MSFKDLNIKISYISQGENKLTDAFLIPALKQTKFYKRSVGFFSSEGLLELVSGIIELKKNRGKIQLIASPDLSGADINTINNAYDDRKRFFTNIFTSEFLEELNKLNDESLILLYELIVEDILDIKIAALKDNSSIYHDKVGILEDFEGNTIVFFGSPNSSRNAYAKNYEKIRVARSWTQEGSEYVGEEIKEFNSLWNNTNKFVDVYEYKEAAKLEIIKIMEHRGLNTKPKESEIYKIREYQQKAIDRWISNKYNGFFVMATGTGKTITAIYALKSLLEKEDCLTVICAPYKHLIKQWANEIQKILAQAIVILVSSENPNWEREIIDSIIRNRRGQKKNIIIVSTIVSFSLERFKKAIDRSSQKKVLIVDEAHRFKCLSEEIDKKYEYKLGLSATPSNGKNIIEAKKLTDFFGGVTYNLPIEKAIGKFLVNYYYYPIFIYSTENDEDKFESYNNMIRSCFKDNICIDKEKLYRAVKGRLRVISMAENKILGIDDILSKVKERNHFIVYCGDGRLYDNNRGEEIRHIQRVQDVLHNHGFRPSRFTASENMSDRMKLVDSFTSGEIDSLVAIRCLDEGIDIPSIEGALILSSNDDYREFVQRRGRILRKFGNKESANIYDVIVLPSYYNYKWATIELRRYYEYAKYALNKNELMDELYSLLVQYDLSFENIQLYEFDDLEESLDE